MQFFQFSYIVTLILLLCAASAYARYIVNSTTYDNNQAVVSWTITVDKSGQGNFTTVQQAIDSVPNNNGLWVRIHIKAGVYTEKVSIQKEKQHIVLEGEGRDKTFITWEEGGNMIESTTFTMLADNFVARDITFQNTYNLIKGVKRDITWAPAALIAADKVSFYRCGFTSVQDTLGDAQGRHYFDSCYIQGVIDFIWGNAQSFYHKSFLDVTVTESVLLGLDHENDDIHKQNGDNVAAYITAQGRESADQSSGFVFSFSNVIGNGPAILGRAYRNFSRVLFYKTHMDNIISPQGWDAWENGGHEDLITFAEVECFGPGADTSNRVNWEKQLSQEELNSLIDVNIFVNQDGWLEKQPI